MRELQLDQRKNCLVGECTEERAGASDLKMLLYNKLPEYLPLRIQYIDNRSVCLYALDGKNALTELLEQEGADASLVKGIYSNILEAVRRGREYLLDPIHLVLEPEYMYWDIQEQRLALCYFPEYRSGMSEKLERFSQYLLRHVNHKDKNGAALMYGLYDLIAENGFQEYQIEKYLKDCAKRDEKGEQESIKEQYKYERWDKIEENHGYQDEKEKSEEHERRGQRRQRENIRKKGRGFTVGLRNISGERGIPQWTVIPEKGITVGRGEENEMILPFIQVSRQHARIEYEGEHLLLTDMNSVNGVRLNGRSLFANRPVRCHCGDEVSFAGISYRIERQETC